MLSDILKENIVVKHEEKSSYPNGHSLISFGSAKRIPLIPAWPQPRKAVGLFRVILMR